MANGKTFISALLVGAASVSSIIAATTAPAAAATEAATGLYRIEGQPLSRALMQLSRQGNVDIVASAQITRGRMGRVVAAESVDAALRQMLAGTGLSYKLIGKRYVIQSGNVQGAAIQGGADSDPKRAKKAAYSQERGNISGTVRDEATGAALKGALVELVGMKRSTSTNDLGEFRFANVPAGDATVRISYLGYAEAQSTIEIGAGETYAETFTLTGGSAVREIVVYGSRSARAQALNQERTAENSQTVVSSDTLGHFDGSTISEALRRVPGVAFEQDEVTGDGTNIIVRGLAPDFNMVTLNGLRLPVGSGTGRSPNLGNILTESVSKVTINKSLLPNMDSSGTGGLIEIETKGPLDRARRFASFSVEGARAAKGFKNEFSVNGTVSATFGADLNFGVSASVQYRQQNIQRYNYDIGREDFSYLPLDDAGNPIKSYFGIDPKRQFPFDEAEDRIYPSSVSTGYNGADDRNLTLTLSAQGKIAGHTDLRFDYTRSQSKADHFLRTTNFLSGVKEQYVLLPIDKLGGKIRAALVASEASKVSNLMEIPLSARQYYSFGNDLRSITESYSFQGKTTLGRWGIDYNLGYTNGSKTTAPSADVYFHRRSNLPTSRMFHSALSEAARSNVTSDGRLVSLFAPFCGNAFPVPLLNKEGFDTLRNPTEWTLVPRIGMNIGSGHGGKNPRYSAKFSTQYSFDSGALKYIEMGGFFESSRFSSAFRDGSQKYRVSSADESEIISMSDLGLDFGGTSLAPIGIAGGADVVSRNDIENLFVNISDVLAANPGLVQRNLDPTDPRMQQTYTNEDNFSFYVMPRLEFGKLEVVGGVRLDWVRIKTRSLINPSLYEVGGVSDPVFASTYSRLADGKANQTAILPRVAATWRKSDDLLVRAAFGMSVARPQIQYLNGYQELTFYLQPEHGPNGDQSLVQLSMANPALKPSITNNYDLSVERYFADAGQAKLSFFYKTIDNMLGSVITNESNSLEGVDIPGDPRLADLSGFLVKTTQTVNGEHAAKIYGIELAVEKQLTFLPGALGGIGFYGNYTYTKGEREVITILFDQNIRRNMPFTGSPKHSGTAALTYNNYGVDATLAYTMQGRSFDDLGYFGLDNYSETDSSLDFRAEYRLDPGMGRWRMWIEASDLLKGPEDADVIRTKGGAKGVPKIYFSGNYYGGRRGALGLSVDF